MVKFTKGHATENDFLLIEDIPVCQTLHTQAIQRLCERRRGLGADGLLRVTTVQNALQAGLIDQTYPATDLSGWFMDYYNADGSVAEMCGNGIRVFAHYLYQQELETRQEFPIYTRAGLRQIRIHQGDSYEGDVSVDMGLPHWGPLSQVKIAGRLLEGLCVNVGNPHLACVVSDLDPSDLFSWPSIEPDLLDPAVFPHGANVEIITPGESQISMRVYERGVGETRSCGTGTVAATVASLMKEGHTTGERHVRVAGGSLQVSLTRTTSYLRGPSVLVACGDFDERWWAHQ